MEPKRRIIEERYCFDASIIQVALGINGELERVELHAGGNGREIHFCAKRVIE